MHGQSADGHVSHTDLVVWAVPFGSLHSYTRFLDLAVHLKAISPCQLRPGFKSAWLKGVCIFERASLALFFPFSDIVLFFVLSMTVSLKGYLSITYVFFRMRASGKHTSLRHAMWAICSRTVRSIVTPDMAMPKSMLLRRAIMIGC